MVNEEGKIEIGVGVNTEELDKYSKKLDKILKQMQQVNGTTVKSTSSVKTLDDKTKKLRETASKTVSGNGSRGLSLSPQLNKSLGNIGSGVNRIKESVSFSRDGTRNIQNKTEHLSKCFEKLSTKTKVAQVRFGAIAEKGGVVGKATGGLSKGFSKLGPLMTRIAGLIGRVGVALGPIGIALGVVAGVIGGVILAITGMIAATAVATAKMKEFASTADNLVKERRSYDPTTATEAGAYRQGLIRQTGKLTDQLGRLSTTLANGDVIKFAGTLDIMRRHYSDVNDALDRHAKTTMRVTAFMDTLSMYLDSLKMGVLDLIEPIISNTGLLKGLATVIDVVTIPLMWLGKVIGAILGVIGEALSVLGSIIDGMIKFVADIPILGDFVKDALKAIDDNTSHAARDFVDDMENVFKKYESGYYKDPYKLNTGLQNTSFMNYEEMRSAADDDPLDTIKDDNSSEITNTGLINILKQNFRSFTEPLLKDEFGLADEAMNKVRSATTGLGKIVTHCNDVLSFFIKRFENTMHGDWTSYIDLICGWVKDGLTFLMELYEGIKDKVAGLASDVMKNAIDIATGIKDKVAGLVSHILTGLTNLGTSIVNKLGQVITDITTEIRNVVSVITSLPGKLANVIGSAVSSAVSHISGGLIGGSKSKSSSKSKSKSSGNPVVNAVAGAVGGAVNAVAGAVGGAVNAVAGAVGAAVNAVTGGGSSSNSSRSNSSRSNSSRSNSSSSNSLRSNSSRSNSSSSNSSRSNSSRSNSSRSNSSSTNNQTSGKPDSEDNSKDNSEGISQGISKLHEILSAFDQGLLSFSTTTGQFVDTIANFVNSLTGDSENSISNILSTVSGVLSTINPLGGHVNTVTNAITKLLTGGGLDLTTIIGLIGEIITGFDGIINIVRKVAGTIKERFSDVFKAIDLCLAKLFGWLGYTASNWDSEHEEPESEDNSKLHEILSAFDQGILSFSTTTGQFVDTIANFVNSLTGDSNNSISNILSTVSGVLSIINPLGGHVNTVVSAISNLIDGGNVSLSSIISTIDEILPAFEAIINIIRNVVGTITSLFRSLFGISKISDSDGLTNTSLSGGGNSDSGNSGIFSKIGGYISSALSSIGGLFTSVFKGIGNLFSGSTKSDSSETLELNNSSKSSSTGSSNEPTIIDPRNVDITINVNTEKADKDFVDQLTESLKKSFLDGLLYG